MARKKIEYWKFVIR